MHQKVTLFVNNYRIKNASLYLWQIKIIREGIIILIKTYKNWQKNRYVIFNNLIRNNNNILLYSLISLIKIKIKFFFNNEFYH